MIKDISFTKGKAVWIKASKYRLKLLIHTSFLIQICWHICYWINIFNGCLQTPPPNTSPPHPQFFVSRWQTCLKFLATIFVNERQRDWVNFTHQRGLPIFSGTMGCWIFSIFTRFNMFLRFYQQLSNQWYWRAPCTWRHSAKILFQQFIYPPI